MNYFLQDVDCRKKIHLINADAEQYVKENQLYDYNLIFCDVFDGDNIPEFVFSMQFIDCIINKMGNRCVFVINWGKIEKNHINDFFLKCSKWCIEKYILFDKSSFITVFIKGQEKGGKEVMHGLSKLIPVP